MGKSRLWLMRTMTCLTKSFQHISEYFRQQGLGQDGFLRLRLLRPCSRCHSMLPTFAGTFKAQFLTFLVEANLSVRSTKGSTAHLLRRTAPWEKKIINYLYHHVPKYRLPHCFTSDLAAFWGRNSGPCKWQMKGADSSKKWSYVELLGAS